MNPSLELKEHVDALTSAFFEHKQQTPDFSAFQSGLNHIQETLQRLETRHAHADAVKNRPVLGSADMSVVLDSEHKKAFHAFLQSGDMQILEPLSRKHVGVRDTIGNVLLPQESSRILLDALSQEGQFAAVARTVMVQEQGSEFLVQEGKALADFYDDNLFGKSEEEDHFPRKVRPEDTASLKKIRIPLHTLACVHTVSQRFLDTRLDLEQWMIESATTAFLDKENHHFLFGTNAWEPQGLIPAWKKYASSLKEDEVQDAASVTEPDASDEQFIQALLAMTDRLPHRYLSKAGFMMSRKTQSILRQLKNASGNSLWQPKLSKDAPATLLGYPVYLVDSMPTLERKPANESQIQEKQSKNVKDSVMAGDMPIIFGHFEQAYTICRRPQPPVLRESSFPTVKCILQQHIGGDLIQPQALVPLTCVAR